MATGDYIGLAIASFVVSFCISFIVTTIINNRGRRG